MDLRHCTLCRLAKETTEFYASQPTRCKVCVRKRVLDYRTRNLEAVRAYDRDRASTDKRRLHNAQTTAGWRAVNPREYKAQTALNNAIRDGKVRRWPVCALPDCDRKPVAHHPNYDAPLDVVWLCQAHHKQAHALAKDAA